MGLLDSILSALGLRQKAPAGDGEGSESVDDDSDSASDEPRDPELEAIDDSGDFDFEADIARYFTAEFRIGTAWDNRERRAALFEEYQIRDAQHWYQIQATFERWLETPAAKALYRTPGDLMRARMTTTQTMTLDDLKLEPVPAPALEPVEGVSLERWAKVEAALAGGTKLEDIAADIGVDAEAWTRISKTWRARMDGDASGEIASAYSKHVGSAGAGKFSAKARS